MEVETRRGEISSGRLAGLRGRARLGGGGRGGPEDGARGDVRCDRGPSKASSCVSIGLDWDGFKEQKSACCGYDHGV